MGSDNVTCAITHMPIAINDPIVAIALTAGRESYEAGRDWSPASFPIMGLYDDYGGIQHFELSDEDAHIFKTLKGKAPARDTMCGVDFDMMLMHRFAWEAILEHGAPWLTSVETDRFRQDALESRAFEIDRHRRMQDFFPDEESGEISDYAKRQWLRSHCGDGRVDVAWGDLLWEDEALALRFRDTIGRLRCGQTTFGYRILPSLTASQDEFTRSWDAMIAGMKALNDQRLSDK